MTLCHSQNNPIKHHIWTQFFKIIFTIYYSDKSCTGNCYWVLGDKNYARNPLIFSAQMCIITDIFFKELCL